MKIDNPTLATGKAKHVPTRTCVCCRKVSEKSSFIRVAKVGDEFVVGNDKVFGRSAYVCKDAQCVAKTVKKRLFDKSFKQKLPEGVYEELTAFLEKP